MELDVLPQQLARRSLEAQGRGVEDDLGRLGQAERFKELLDGGLA